MAMANFLMLLPQVERKNVEGGIEKTRLDKITAEHRITEKQNKPKISNSKFRFRCQETNFKIVREIFFSEKTLLLKS